MPQSEQSPQIDERVWQAWIKKNEAKDKARFKRRVKVIKLVSVLALGVLLWRFTT